MSAAEPRVLAFAGSVRNGSVNRQLLDHAAGVVREQGLAVTTVDLADYPLPLFNEDLEAGEGTPDAATRLKALFLDHQALLLACPEYNSSITPLLKNTIDWMSRKAEGEGPLAAFDGKVVGLLAASPGSLGGLRGLVHVRDILGNIRCHVLPEQVAVPKAHEAFDEQGRLTAEPAASLVQALAASLARTTTALHAAP